MKVIGSVLKKNGPVYNPDFVIIDEQMRLDELKDTYAAIKQKVEEKKIPTAIITLADFLAIGAMKAVKEVGLSAYLALFQDNK